MGTAVNIYCDESTHLPHDQMPYMVLGAITCPQSQSRAIHQHLRELRSKHGLARDFEIKWSKVSPSKLGFYLDVVDYFFNNDDLSFRAVIAPKNALDHQSFNQTHDDWYYKMLFYLLRSILVPTHSSFIYLDKKDTRGSEKAQRLHEVVCNSKYDFNRHFIKNIQIVESHHVGLLQLTDLLTGAVNYTNRLLESSKAKQAIVSHIQQRSGLMLTRSTLLHEPKFNLFRWEPREIGSK